MSAILLHLGGSSWDELAMMVGAIALALVIVKFTMRPAPSEEHELGADSDGCEGNASTDDLPDAESKSTHRPTEHTTPTVVSCTSTHKGPDDQPG